METVKDISNVRLFCYPKKHLKMFHFQGRECNQGPPGPPGLGVPGPPGRDGRDGLPGEKGSTGEIGPAGLEGPIGPKGSDGQTGEKGSTGEIGPAGPIGPKGSDGQTGPSGINGRDGLSGVSGTPGAPGPKGDQGPTGQPGSLGPKGPNGEPGPRGNEGPRGASGEPGPKGDQGTQNIGEIAFAAYNDNSGYPQNTFLSFNEVPENIGGAFNGNTGVFTSPRTATYIFGFTAEVFENPTHCYIYVYINDSGKRYFYNYHSDRHNTFSFNLIEKLNAQDKLKLKLGGGNCKLIANSNRKIYFHGYIMNSS